MKDVVRQILNNRAKAKQVDMMLNPPDIIAGGPGSGRRPGGGREREGAGSAYDKMHQDKIKKKRERLGKEIPRKTDAEKDNEYENALSPHGKETYRTLRSQGHAPDKAAHITVNDPSVRRKLTGQREKKQQEQEEATNTLNREKVEQRLDSAGAKRSKLAGMVGKRVKLKDGRRGRIVKDDGGGFGFLEDKRK